MPRWVRPPIGLRSRKINAKFSNIRFIGSITPIRPGESAPYISHMIARFGQVAIEWPFPTMMTRWFSVSTNLLVCEGGERNVCKTINWQGVFAHQSWCAWQTTLFKLCSQIYASCLTIKTAIRQLLSTKLQHMLMNGAVAMTSRFDASTHQLIWKPHETFMDPQSA